MVQKYEKSLKGWKYFYENDSISIKFITFAEIEFLNRR